jgi:hypothetical protein
MDIDNLNNINSLTNINCLDEEDLDPIKLEELKYLSQEYGLDQHGTKITLCKNIQSYLKAIETPNSENLNKTNILMIHNIYDLIRVLRIDDLKELHTLSYDDIIFLWETTQNEIDNIDLNADLEKIREIYISADELDLKVVILIEVLSKLFCECIASKQKYGKKKISICKKTILNRVNVNASNYICDSNNNVLLPKFGSRDILHHFDKK